MYLLLYLFYDIWHGHLFPWENELLIADSFTEDKLRVLMDGCFRCALARVMSEAIFTYVGQPFESDLLRRLFKPSKMGKLLKVRGTEWSVTECRSVEAQGARVYTTRSRTPSPPERWTDLRWHFVLAAIHLAGPEKISPSGPTSTTRPGPTELPVVQLWGGGRGWWFFIEDEFLK